MEQLTFGQRLDRMLRMKRMTQSDLARAVGVNRVSVHAWIHGKQMPRAQMIMKIADALGCTTSDLMDDQTVVDVLNEFFRTLTDEERKKILDHLKAM